MTDSLSKIMAQKEDYQLKWISGNKNTHTVDEVRAAIVELEKRQVPRVRLNKFFKGCWKSVTSIFGYD